MDREMKSDGAISQFDMQIDGDFADVVQESRSNLSCHHTRCQRNLSVIIVDECRGSEIELQGFGEQEAARGRNEPPVSGCGGRLSVNKAHRNDASFMMGRRTGHSPGDWMCVRPMPDCGFEKQEIGE
jgi:hypothetical protein